MCGIVGCIGADAAARSPLLEKSLDELDHRGPEARSVKVLSGGGETCALGHTRLRIVDTSEDGDQPIADERESVWVVFNGELYNHAELRRELVDKGHHFRSRTDTEVIVHLYEDCNRDPERLLPRLRGMFAIGLFDIQDGSLLLARDRLGIKPLYWNEADGVLTFASEVRAVAAAAGVETTVDPIAASSFLNWGVVQGPRSILQNIAELPPATYMRVSRAGRTVRRWWAPTFEAKILPADASARVASALRDSVDRHLIADRPVGLFLSSGVDSGAIAAVAARSRTIRALTVTFGDARGDESVGASIQAERLGIELEKVEVTGAEVADQLPQILSSMDQPTADGVNSWLISRAARSAGLVVALSGLGGDELFGGYPSFALVPQVRRITNLTARLPRGVRELSVALVTRRHPGGRAARILGAELGYEEAYRSVRGLFSPKELPQALAYSDGSRAGLDGVSDARDIVTLLELQGYMRNQLLRDTDQMSMAHSLEVRVPLLDDEVVSTALSLPPEVRTAAGKDILVRAAGLTRAEPKRGFTLPFETWLRGPLRETLREGLLSEDLSFSKEFPRAFRMSLWTSFEEKRVHWSRPWAISVLRLWPSANGFSFT